MIEAIKEQAAKFILRQRTSQREFNQRNFSSVFKKSFSFLVLMPVDDKDFRLAGPILEYLKEQKKSVVVLTNDFKVSLLPTYLKANAMGHGIKDVTKLKLPARSIITKLSNMRFDVIIDLNRQQEIFYTYLTKALSVPLKIGFVYSESDNYFNMQIANSRNEPEISYKNLLNCLRMF
ncbi:MAG: hypothetical protein KJN64_04005 [Ignavibacteria bacterium]|nr:hypothetical protein [Ignavibacteria bacterium]MBT8383261.1 hypothetical protein [Ignavibacteria bacterium]MBT8390366.1 hypothetical protein [Ignavibacteria bacterium]NNJ53374.1 hypothetical protein [Ignavibacteriaceae bacterium]NNL21611.1 hypothetical protein [Ignavibacteriaceae bacterium]